MNDRRTPRAHLQSTAVGEEPEQEFPVSPALVEYLERTFPVRLSPRFLGVAAQDIIQDQAEQRGQQQVIERLRNLSNR